MVKLGIHYDIPSMTYVLNLKKHENGATFYAKNVTIEWEPCTYKQRDPFVILPEDTIIEQFDVVKSDYQSKYEEVKSNKAEHIGNLNSIINKLLERQ